MKTSGLLTRAYRMLRLAVHVLYAVAIAGLVFPWVEGKMRQRLVRHWSAGLLAILNIRIHVHGTPPDLSARNAMLVANHVSWLDIYLLNSVRPARFVSKSEVRSWPLVGWLAHKSGTFFIERARRHDTARVNHEMSAALESGECVAIFPEGTTSPGDTLLPFHASLLQPAVHSASTVWPTALRYTHADGSLNLCASYVGEMSLGQSLKKILAQPEMHAELVFMPAVSAHGKTRRELAQQTALSIAGALQLSCHPQATTPAIEQLPPTELSPA